jgi:hypothetical protein
VRSFPPVALSSSVGGHCAGPHALAGVPNTRVDRMATWIECAKPGARARCTLASQPFPQWVLPNGLAAVVGPGIFSLRRALRRAPLNDARWFGGCGLACCAAVGGPDRQAARPRLCSCRLRAGAAARNEASPCGVEEAVTSAALRVAGGFRLIKGGRARPQSRGETDAPRLVSCLTGVGDRIDVHRTLHPLEGGQSSWSLRTKT